MTQLQTGRPSRKEKAIEAVQKDLENLSRLNINIPKKFYGEVKRKAFDAGVTVTTFVKKALSEYMSK